MTGLFILAGLLALVEAVYSAKNGIDFFRLFQNARRRRSPDYTPPLTLILPCKGIDRGLEQNLSAYFELDYPDFQIVLVTGRPSDECVPLIQGIRAAYDQVTSQVLFAGSPARRSQKVHNLLHALASVRQGDEALVFGDSDIRPHRGWLRALVAPLADPQLGISTGFRWYLPVQGNFASILRSVWNAGIASILNERNSPFAWGGAMAVRREVFEQAGVTDYWEGALSDDFAMSRAIHEAGRRIRFEPRCLSFSHEDCSLMELLEWSGRQLAITRVYHPWLWRAALFSQVVNNMVLWGGASWVLIQIFSEDPAGFGQVLLGSLLAVIYLLGCFKGWIRLRAVQLLFPEHESSLQRHRAAYIFWGPLAALVSLWGLLRSAASREVSWRGMRYRMVSPSKTIFLGGD